MYQANIISSNIVRLGGRSYNQRMKISEPGGASRSRLLRLNSDLEGLYELMYEHWRELDRNVYSVIDPQLSILLETLQELIKAYGNLSENYKFTDEIKRLEMNYSALMELKSDIQNFGLNQQIDLELKEILEMGSIKVIN